MYILVFNVYRIIFHYRVVGHCRNCEELDNKARLRADYSTYRLMLRNIKQTEEDYNDGSHIIFLMQVRIHIDKYTRNSELGLQLQLL